MIIFEILYRKKRNLDSDTEKTRHFRREISKSFPLAGGLVTKKDRLRTVQI